MEALKTILRIKRVPKSVMERMKPWDAEELRLREQKVRLKCRSQLDKGVDWELMKKHLHTPEARQAYEDFCRKTRVGVENQVVGLLYKRRPDRYFQYYYGNYLLLQFKEQMLTKGKNILVKGKNILVKMESQIWAFGWGIASISAYWMLVGNEKEKLN
ncbi:hypothetical protein RHGRI_028178 [Rhododendron griersonianum]|uniref:Uncharacterized protein n=1 Tax=Rhododendron griersonianum TaxID=479676 RepID=A0AAV6II31_9ERIC|nr:hypothetical protein RHGRI_028178 [Rhododendron griersonianum]